MDSGYSFFLDLSQGNIIKFYISVPEPMNLASFNRFNRIW